VNAGMSTNGRPDDPDQIAAVAALTPYLTAIRSHWRMVVGVMLVAAVASFVWVRHAGTTYESTAAVLVAPVPPDDVALAGLPVLRAGGADTRRSVETAADLLETDDAARSAANRVGGIDQSGVESAVEVSANTDANLVEIKATSGSAEQAAAIANAYAKAALSQRAAELKPLIEQSAAATRAALAAVQDQQGTVADELRARLSALETLDGDPSLSIAREAQVPSSPTGSPLWLVLAAALIGGLVLGSVTAVLSEVLAPRVLRHEEDLAGVFERPVLARMPEVPRSALRTGRGRRRAAAAREAFRSLRGQLELRAADRSALGLELEEGSAGGLAVLITSPSRGDGRSYTATGLARAFAAGGASVVLLDADLRRRSGGPDIRGSGLQAVAEGGDLSAALQPVTGIPAGGVLTAPRGLSVAAAESLSAKLPSVIASCRSAVDWVVIDAPPMGAVSDAVSLSRAVDELVIVVRRNHTVLLQLSRLRELLKQAGVPATGYLFIGGVRIADPRYDYGDEEPLPWTLDPGGASLPG
jgi:succinoglycan biosynthesis transport protein ExoP